MNPFRSPLHIQIFIALILGVIVGVLFNPGERLLEEEFTFRLSTQDGLVMVD